MYWGMVSVLSGGPAKSRLPDAWCRTGAGAHHGYEREFRERTPAATFFSASRPGSRIPGRYGDGVDSSAGVRREVRAALELLAACGFAIAQPVLSVYGRSPDTFIFHDAQSRQIVWFALVVAFVPPLVLWLTEFGVGLVSRAARRIVHAAFLIGLAALFAVQLAKHMVTPAAAVVAIAAVVVAICIWLYVRVDAARTWLLYTSPATVVFVALFVFSSSVSQLVFPKPVRAAQLGSVVNAPSVVMITFDEWPTSSFVGADGGVDRTLFPNIAAFADQATWYRNATSITSATWHAVPAILTGMYPKSSQIPEASSHPRNLFTFLGGSYHLDVSESVTRLCPPSLCNARQATTTGSSGVPGLLDDAATTFRKMVSPRVATGDVTRGFEEIETSTAVGEAVTATGPGDHANIDLGAATANRPERFDQFLRGIHAGEEPTLHFLHILLPHVVYRYLPDGREYAYPDHDFGKVGDEWSSDGWPAELAHQRLELQAMYVDRLVGELTARLRAEKMLDRSVVVLTADHGITFVPGSTVRGLDAPAVPTTSYPQLLWAPLFVKAAAQTRGVVSDANVMSIDVLPTIAKLTGFRLPWKVDGVAAGERADPTKVFVKSTENPFGFGVGPPINYDGVAGEKAMLAGNAAVFAPAPGTLQMYRVGPHADLVGKPLAQTNVGAATDNEASLVQFDQLRSVDLKRSVIPALVWGTTRRDATVVIAINGVIAGVSPTFTDNGTERRFAMMLPESLLRSGDNHAQAFEVEGSGGGTTLHPIALRGG
jgi:hypothetical protein